MRERPIDLFANDFLRYCADALDFKPDTLPKVKVLMCTDNLWTQLPSVKSLAPTDSLSERADDIEMTPEKWQEITGWCVLLMSRDSADRIVKVSERDRVKILMHGGFPREHAEAYAPFDSLVFVHVSNLSELRKRIKVQPLRLYITVAHECIHLLRRLSSRITPREFDRKGRLKFPAAPDLLADFVTSMPGDEFRMRYAVSHDSTNEALVIEAFRRFWAE